MPYINGGGGGGGPAAGSYLPVAGAGATLDTTTYNDSVSGTGKYRTLVLPAEDAAFAIAQSGDAFPRLILSSDPTDYGLLLGNGAQNPALNVGASISLTPTQLVLSPGSGRTEILVANSKPVNAGPPTIPNHLARIANVSPYLTVTSGALSTAQLVTATAAQLPGAGGGDAETLTPVTFNPSAGAAATCKVELSADNVTFSTLGTETEPAGIAFDGTIHIVKVRVPASWYLKLTVTNATLGLTTYY